MNLFGKDDLIILKYIILYIREADSQTHVDV